MYKEKNSSSIHGIPVLKDNIIWIWVKGEEAVVIDPSIAKPVEFWLKKQNLKLAGVLQTHHHDDHIAGTKDLIKQWPNSPVVASSADRYRIPLQTISVAGGDELNLMGSTIKVLDVAGHTNAHVAYYLAPEEADNNEASIFCGDTLFGGGCGRLFEGTAEEMYKALSLLKALPDQTKVYCAHEYTQSNLQWALSIYPKDLLIERRLSRVIELRRKGVLSIPTTILEEKETNLFMRARNVEEFCVLRLHKDNWKN